MRLTATAVQQQQPTVSQGDWMHGNDVASPLTTQTNADCTAAKALPQKVRATSLPTSSSQA